MKKVIRLTESDLIRVIKRVINEQEEPSVNNVLNNLNRVPTNPPAWLNKFFNLPTQQFNEFTKKSKLNLKEPRNHIEILNTLKSIGCVNFEKCFNELNKYRFNLESSYRQLKQEVDNEKLRKIQILLNVLEFFKDYKQPPLK